MMERLKLKIQRGLTDGNFREVIIGDDYVEFENKDTLDSHTKFTKGEIIGFRYGINLISYIVTFGRQYRIEIQNNQNKVLKIYFASYFGYKKQENHEKYRQIIDALWKTVFLDAVKVNLEKFNHLHETENVLVGKVTLSKQGINFKTNFIRWDDLGIKNYQTYFSVFSIANPATVNVGYSYKDDWNTAILSSTLMGILSQK